MWFHGAIACIYACRVSLKLVRTERLACGVSHRLWHHVFALGSKVGLPRSERRPPTARSGSRSGDGQLITNREDNESHMGKSKLLPRAQYAYAGGLER